MPSIKTAKVSDTATHPEHTSLAEKVAANDNLLTEILLRLPIRSLLRFKSVSKHWLSLISDPYFSRRRNPYPYTPSGLFLHPSTPLITPELDFLPLNNDENPTDAPFRALTFFPGLRGIRLSHSCNGLLSCSSFYPVDSVYNYYIYNPTTKQFITLPQPGEGVLRNVVGLNLAFDPSKSPHYKVVCVWSTVSSSIEKFQIEIYSSETGRWRKFGELFTGYGIQVHGGVYWNGAINWISFWGDSVYFNVDQERLGTMPMLPVHDGCYERPFRYFGESRGHLHLVEIYDQAMTQFNVYEMKRDYSEWFVTYHVDLDGVASAFPEMIRSHFGPMDSEYYAFAILCLVRGEEDEDSFLVLHIPGKALCYNFVDKTFKKYVMLLHVPMIQRTSISIVI